MKKFNLAIKEYLELKKAKLKPSIYYFENNYLITVIPVLLLKNNNLIKII
jgi:hypothetical protein